MAISPSDYSPTGDGSSLGNLLQIVFTDGIINQISEDFKDWDMVYRQAKSSDQQPRAIAFMLQTSLGARATQFVAQGANLIMPSGQKTRNNEYEAQLKQIASTVELELDVYERAMKSPKYAEPLAHEIASKSVSQKRILSSTLHKDGTGVIGKLTVANVTKGAGASEIVITFDNSVSGTYIGDKTYGGERWCEFEDALDIASEAGASTFTKGDAAGTTSYLLVVDKDRDNDSVTCEAYDSSDALVAITDDADAIVVVGAGKLVYRKDHAVGDRADLSSVPGGEYNALTNDLVGLESLFSNDGRLVNGITMSGASSATKKDLASKSLDISSFQSALSKVKNRVGQGRYKYKQMLSSYEAVDFLIESQETDRRLVNINDDKRGARGFGYIHGNDTLMLDSSEFCKSDKIYVLPESSKQKGVCELHGEEFKDVKVDGNSTFMKTDSASGNRMGVIEKFMLGRMVIVSRHPAAALVIEDFIVE